MQSAAEFRAELRAVLDRWEGGGEPMTRIRPKAIRAKAMTFRVLGESWTSGKLHAQYPDQVRAKSERTRVCDASRLTHLYATLGYIDVADLTLEHAEAAMATLPATAKRPGTRRLYAGAIAYLMRLARYPLGLITESPIPKGFVPPQGKAPAFPFLYPSEETRLMLYTGLSRVQRLLYGVLAREGLRVSEALALRWPDLDLQRGTIRLDKNKTGNPRFWKLGDDVVKALVAHCEAAEHPLLVFGGLPEDGRRADRFRSHLRQAGVKRPDLHQTTKERRPIRVHDLRASFITLALAAGRSETWVQDRTGHATSAMLNLYRRQARHAAELELGWFEDLHTLLFSKQGTQKMPRKPQTKTHNTGSNRGQVADDSDPVEMNLAVACKLAAEAGEWETVRVLSAQLAERYRLVKHPSSVASIEDARARRDGK